MTSFPSPQVSIGYQTSHPVGRAVQAAACKAGEAGAIPARDSTFIRSSRREEAHSEARNAECRMQNENLEPRYLVSYQHFSRRCVRVANFDSEVPALNRREHGANP